MTPYQTSAATAASPARRQLRSREGNGSAAGSVPPVLVVAPQPFYEDRGTPIAVRQLVEALSQLGLDTDVLTYPVGRTLSTSGVRFFRVSNPFRIGHVPVGLSWRKVMLDGLLVPSLHARLARNDYLCIHAVEESGFPAVLLGRRFRVPVVYDMQSSLPEQLQRHRVFRTGAAQAALHACERWLLRKADFVVSSMGLAEHVRRVAPDSNVREWRFSHSAPEATEEEILRVREELRIPPRSRVVLYSGTFEPYQGLPVLLEAMPLVLAEAPDAVFVLVGARAGQAAALARRAKGLLDSGSLRVVERQPRERIPNFLALADVLVSPRTAGGNVPLKVFDYLGSGKPIVATDIPAHRSLLEEDCAELVPPSPAGLAAAILRLLRDPERAALLGASAAAYAESRHGWLAFVQSVGELYAEVRARSRYVQLAR